MTHVTVLIASPLEAVHVEQMQAIDPHIEVIFRPDLLGRARYPADHYALPERSAAQEQEWLHLLGRAEVLFDFDRTHLHDLLTHARQLRWVQSTSSGIGSLLVEYGFDQTDLLVTNAAGTHAVPLTEFCLMAMLMEVKRFRHAQSLQQAHRWERFHATTLRGKTLGIIGLGAIGKELGRSARAMGMYVHGIKSVRPADLQPEDLHVDQLWGIHDLAAALPHLDFVVSCLPHTQQTINLISRREFGLMRRGAFFINIGRGPTVDEPELIEALQSGHLSGAALDVVASEPLDTQSPLWDMPNVTLFPHSAATVDQENQLLTDLFCDNLRRYLDGRPLRNVVDKRRGY